MLTTARRGGLAAAVFFAAEILAPTVVGEIMRRGLWLLGLLMLTASSVGCRCFPGFNLYADIIDDNNDYPILWDQWYVPRLDISRAGRPDWCGPINRRLAPCRCDCVGEFKRADECWRYPSHYPYWYPSHTLTMTTYDAVGPLPPPQADGAPPMETAPVPPTPTLEPAPVPGTRASQSTVP